MELSVMDKLMVNLVWKKTPHPFYYQVQGQLMITGVTVCDFLVYTRKEIHMERIHPDVDFMKELGLNLSEIYFCLC